MDRHRASRGILRPHTWWQKALRLNAAGIRHNAAGLLLERMRIVQDFVVYFDALVWWEVHYNNTYVDPDIVRNTVRNIMLNPVLDYADAALADVRGLVEGECTERLETYSQPWTDQAVVAFKAAREDTSPVCVFGPPKW